MDVVRADHHHHIGSSLVAGLVGKFADLRDDLAAFDRSWNKVCLADEIRDERRGRRVVNRFRRVELLEPAVVQYSEKLRRDRG
jgi:hypothetical protein